MEIAKVFITAGKDGKIMMKKSLYEGIAQSMVCASDKDRSVDDYRLLTNYLLLIRKEKPLSFRKRGFGIYFFW